MICTPIDVQFELNAMTKKPLFPASTQTRKADVVVGRARETAWSVVTLRGLTVINGRDDDREVPFVEGSTREQSRQIAKEALRNLAIELAKRQARAEFEIATGMVKRTRKVVLTPAGGTCGWRRTMLKNE